jgi:ketosteroid isomerase-like protein
MSDKNVQAVRSLYDAFDRGDFNTLEKGVSSNVVWNEADNSLYSAGSPYRSFTEIRDKVFSPNSRDFDNFHLDIDRILDASDDHVVCAGRYRGKFKETGKELSTQFCHVMHVDPYGKVDFFQEFADTYDQAQVTGRVKPFAKMEIRQPMPA